MIASIVLWIVTKFSFGAIAAEGLKEIPWKKVFIGLIAIAVVAVIGFGYLHVENLKNDLVTSNRELGAERLKSSFERARADAIASEHDTQVSQLQALEDRRFAIEAEMSELRQTLANLNLEDISSEDQAKADAAIARLNDRNTELNRLQNHQSGARQLRPAKAGTGKAVKAGSPGFVRRAIQALRPNGVSQP